MDRSPKSPDVRGAVVTAFAVDPRSAWSVAPVFVATTSGLFRSEDGGQTWTAVNDAARGPFVEALALSISSRHEVILVAGAPDGLHRSVDEGRTWQHVLAGSHVLSIAAARSPEPEHAAPPLFVGTELDGIVRSDDGGTSWRSANAGLWDLTVLALAVSPAFALDAIGFAGTASGLHRSRNGGKSWRLVDGIPDEVAVQCLGCSPIFVADRLVLAGTEAHGLLRSTDAGATWEPVADLATTGIAALAFSSNYLAGGTIAAGTGNGVAISRDEGRTWQPIGRDCGPVLALAFVRCRADDLLLVSSQERGVDRLRRAMGTWASVEGAAPGSTLAASRRRAPTEWG